MWIVFQIRATAFPKSRNRCPDLGQTHREQQFLLRFREEIVQKGILHFDGPGFAYQLTDSHV